MVKSFVSMEQHQCPVCLKCFDTGNILMDKKVRPKFDQRTVTDFEMCDEHKKMRDDGFIALIELTRAPVTGENALTVPRTGNLAHFKTTAWPSVFNVPPPKGGVAVIEVGVIDKIKAMTSDG